MPIAKRRAFLEYKQIGKSIAGAQEHVAASYQLACTLYFAPATRHPPPAGSQSVQRILKVPRQIAAHVIERL